MRTRQIRAVSYGAPLTQSLWSHARRRKKLVSGVSEESSSHGLPTARKSGDVTIWSPALQRVLPTTDRYSSEQYLSKRRASGSTQSAVAKIFCERDNKKSRPAYLSSEMILRDSSYCTVKKPIKRSKDRPGSSEPSNNLTKIALILSKIEIKDRTSKIEQNSKFAFETQV